MYVSRSDGLCLPKATISRYSSWSPLTEQKPFFSVGCIANALLKKIIGKKFNLFISFFHTGFARGLVICVGLFSNRLGLQRENNVRLT